MGKRELRQRETQVATGDSVGKQLEQTYTFDDNCLPSPQELQAYKEIDPRIVEYLITASVNEQKHRHKVDIEKIKTVKGADRRATRINWWGMLFAFLAIVVMLLLAAYALYLDKPWFAGMFGLGSIVSVASIFIRTDQKPK